MKVKVKRGEIMNNMRRVGTNSGMREDDSACKQCVCSDSNENIRIRGYGDIHYNMDIGSSCNKNMCSSRICVKYSCVRAVFVIVLVSILQVTYGFNLDLTNRVEFKGPNEGSYFGYSAAMLNKDSSNKWLLFGAPVDNSSFLSSAVSPGAIHKCTFQLGGAQSCVELFVDDKVGDDLVQFDGRGRTFIHGRDNQWLGASLDLQRDTGIVTCASRWYNQKFLLSHDSFFMNGFCYEIPLDFNRNNIRKIPALVLGDKQTMTVKNQTRYNYGMGSLGSSVHYTQQGRNLLLGAPGLRTWTGGFVDLRGGNTYITEYEKDATEISEMAGYAMSSGKYFGGGIVYFAIGAPREQLTGKVFLYSADKTEYIIENAAVALSGEESDAISMMPVNSYFGATLCSVDVNNDGFDDLLIAAPFYSNVSGDNTARADTGVVLVYLGQQQMKFTVMASPLTGSGKADGRFGSAIASMGDLNRDGFNDVVIGAPYEEDMQGAIYIYNGCKSGIWPKYTLRIPASDVASGLKSFGISFSKATDMNDDGINDIAVGAYLSDSAFLFFGQPVINVAMSLTTTVNQVDRASPDKCKYFNTSMPCFDVSICFNNPSREHDIEVTVTTTLDVYMADFNRLFWQSNDGPTEVRTQRIFGGSTDCISNSKVLVKSSFDLVTPILIRAEYTVDSIPASTFIKPTINKFDGSDPSNNLLVATKLLDFKKDCPNNECQTDLHLKAVPKYEKTDGYFIIGTPSISLDITISKSGDPSYTSNLFVTYPKSLQFVKINKIYGDPEISCGQVTVGEDEDSEMSSGQTSLQFLLSRIIPKKSEDEMMMVCSFGNPLSNDTGVRFDLVLSVPSYITDTQLDFRLNATTLSTEQAPADNTQKLSVAVRNKVTTSLNGVSRPSYQTLYDTQVEYHLSHVLEFNNQGPSPVPTATLMIRFPQIQKGGKPQLYLNKTTWSCRSPCAVTCSFPDSQVISPEVHSVQKGPTYYVNESPSTGRVGEARELTDMQNIDCTNADCSRYECTINNIPPLGSAVVSMDMVMAGSILDDVNDGNAITVGSEAIVQLGDMARIMTTTREHIIEVKTDVMPVSPPPEKVAWWIIFISILGGILLIVIIVLILWKCGFFKRKQRDEMQKMQHTGEVKPMLDEEDGEIKE